MEYHQDKTRFPPYFKDRAFIITYLHGEIVKTLLTSDDVWYRFGTESKLNMTVPVSVIDKVLHLA